MAGIVAALATALAFAGVAAASTAPTPHDRALVKQLVTQVNTFSALSSPTGADKALKNCSFLKKDPAQAFSAAIAIVPALLIEIVDRNKPQVVKLRGALAAMHPDSTLFRQWLGAEVKSLDLLLRFDNGGKPIDLCKAAQVMLSKKSTAADVHAVLGIDPALVLKLYESSASGPGHTLTKLNPKMRTFFISAGMTPKQAKALTT